MHNEYTTKRGYPLPHGENYLEDDVERLRDTFFAIELDMGNAFDGLKLLDDNKLDKADTPTVSAGTGASVQKDGTNYTVGIAQTEDLVRPEAPEVLNPPPGGTDVDKNEILRFAYSHPLNAEQAGLRVQISSADGVLLHDSGWLGAVLEYAVPEGIHGVDTEYLVRAQVMSFYGRTSEWSEEVRYRTRRYFAQIFGAVVLGPGEVRSIDANGNYIALTMQDLASHPIWGGMLDVVSDGQAMVRVPKCYGRRRPGPEGSDAAGRECWWLSDAPAEGFSLFPTFRIAGNVELEYFLVGKYEACADPDDAEKLASLPGQTSAVSISFETAKARCAARGAGWHMWEIQELTVIQYLALIELCTFDVQARIAEGPTSKPLTGSTDVVYRGIHGLWRHIGQFIDGIEALVGFYTGPVYSYSVNLFSEDGSRNMESHSIRIADAAGVKSFYSGGKLDRLFLSSVGTGNSSETICPDRQSAGPTGYTNTTQTNKVSVGGKCTDGKAAGLWYLEPIDPRTPTNANLGTRIAKR